MKFSYNWICEFVPGLTTEPAELQRLITMKTAECEGVEPVGAYFNDVVVARVLTVEPLPNIKNKVVTIDVGNGKQAVVVCGAPNVRVGLLAPWVPPGTLLGDATIGRVLIDGIESEGMLASPAELKLNNDHSGLLELENRNPGERLSDLKPDWVIEIDNKSLTHRPDLWGHYGMAREVAAFQDRDLTDPVKPGFLPHGHPAVEVEIEDRALCPRYSALGFENVQVSPSPLWLQARLENIGLNPINNIVDVTNFVLAELPQPMHAFDADKLQGKTILVRNAIPGERLHALNGEIYSLVKSDLVIADSSGPIALAGVIGGFASAISNTTTRIVLESANFQATSVRLTSSRHRLRTDASMRFEKSLDPENTARGLARAAELLGQVCRGIRPVGGVVDNRAPLPPNHPILLPIEFVVRKLGKEVSQDKISQILHALGFAVMQTAPGVLSVTVPTWRATKDISLKDDLVEEIGRMIGYQEIIPTAPLVACVPPPSNPMRIYLRRIRAQLSAQGFTEIYNYSFVNEIDAKRFFADTAGLIAVVNPIASDLTHLRASLLPGIFNNIARNVRHYTEFRIFELGSEIRPKSGTDLPDEITHAVAAIYNAHGDERDFFELKRVVECLFPGARLAAVHARKYEHPARVAEIHWRDTVIGRIFELHPSLLQEAGIEGRAVLFDLDLQLSQNLAASRIPKYSSLRKYPTSGFDLSVVAELKTPVDYIQDQLANLAGAHLAKLDFIRQYDGPPLPPGQKSVSYHLEVGALDHTMSAEEVTEIRNRIIEGMRRLSFELRV